MKRCGKVMDYGRKGCHHCREPCQRIEDACASTKGHKTRQHVTGTQKQKDRKKKDGKGKTERQIKEDRKI